MPPQFVLNEQALHRLINHPNGPVARKVREEARQIVVETKEHLNVPRGSFRGANPNPFPFKRSGDLRDSVVAAPILDVRTRDLTYAISAGAVHKGVQYSTVLMHGGGLAHKPFDLVPPRIRKLQ